MNVICCYRSLYIWDYFLALIFTHEIPESIVYVSHSSCIRFFHFIVDVLRNYLFFLDFVEYVHELFVILHAPIWLEPFTLVSLFVLHALAFFKLRMLNTNKPRLVIKDASRF